MRDDLLDLLACPRCGGALARRDGAGEVLACAGCGAGYPVLGGVPRLLPDQVHAEAARTARRFGAQWKTFDHMAAHQERWLRRWLAPLGPEDFRGRSVLEAGCGKGRHTVSVAAWGARAVVALDLGDAVDVAAAHARGLENVQVVQGDLLRPPVRPRAFDLVFCVGVLHHLPDPRVGFEALLGAVRPGGRIAIWVYGYERNEWIVRFVSPLRERITSRLPPRLLYGLTLPPSLLLAGAARLWPRRAPYGAYLRELAAVPARDVHNIVYDQLAPPIAFYLRREQVASWFERPELRDVQIAWHNQNSWRASARVVG